MKVMLNRLSEEQLNTPVYKNYAVGYISIAEQMKFLLVHLQRHIKQIDKTFKKMKYEN
jgi:phosphoketolase